MNMPLNTGIAQHFQPVPPAAPLGTPGLQS